jgi:hypothetical protein
VSEVDGQDVLFEEFDVLDDEGVAILVPLDDILVFLTLR